LKIPAPRERLHDDAPGQQGFQLGLRLLQAVQRNAHVHMVGGVLHDVVHQGANFQRECEVHRGGHEGLGFGPSAAVIVPRHFHMGVVHIDHEANHAAPEQERHHKTAEQQPQHGLVGGQSGENDAANPQGGKGGDQPAVAHKNGAASGHFFGGGEDHFFPPNFNHVVQTGCPATAVDAVQQTTHPRQLGKFFLCERGPNKVETFEVGVAVVHHVVADVPQAVSGERGQEGNAAQPFVQAAVGCQALVASVMANDEQAANGETHGHGAQQFGPPGFKEHGAGQKTGPNGVIHQQQGNGAKRDAVRQRHQPLADHLAVRHGFVNRNGLFKVGHKAGALAHQKRG
jgi:hypothetical protein